MARSAPVIREKDLGAVSASEVFLGRYSLETQGKGFTIGQASRLSGLTTKTIRYYDAIGLVEPSRDANGYRLYYDAQLRQLKLIARGRQLGFSIEECRQLLSIAGNGIQWSSLQGDSERRAGRRSDELNALIAARLRDVEQKIATLINLKKQVQQFACVGETRSFR